MSEMCKWAGYREKQLGVQEGVRWILDGSTLHCEISMHDASDGWPVRRMQRTGDFPSKRRRLSWPRRHSCVAHLSLAEHRWRASWDGAGFGRVRGDSPKHRSFHAQSMMRRRPSSSPCAAMSPGVRSSNPPRDVRIEGLGSLPNHRRACQRRARPPPEIPSACGIVDTVCWNDLELPWCSLHAALTSRQQRCVRRSSTLFLLSTSPTHHLYRRTSQGHSSSSN